MKSLNLLRFFNLCTTLAAAGLLFTFVGCAGSPGKTTKEIHREHVNYVGTNWLMLQQDIDEFLMIDRSSRLSDAINR
jgi:hypothetical protein